MTTSTTNTTTVPPFLLLFLLTALLSMFAASFHSFTHSPASSPVAGAERGNKGAGSVPPEPVGITELPDGGSSLALTEKQADSLSELMRRVQADPKDSAALLEIGDTFLMAQDWPRAAVFLSRAAMSSPQDPRPRYMLGICFYQQGRMPEAAAAFEEALALKKDPSAQYNLAVIYKYHLNKQGRAEELLRAIIDSPDTDLDTMEKARQELSK